MLFQIPYISKIMQYLSCSDLFHLALYCLGLSIYVVLNGKILFLAMAKLYSHYNYITKGRNSSSHSSHGQTSEIKVLESCSISEPLCFADSFWCIWSLPPPSNGPSLSPYLPSSGGLQSRWTMAHPHDLILFVRLCPPVSLYSEVLDIKTLTQELDGDTGDTITVPKLGTSDLTFRVPSPAC